MNKRMKKLTAVLLAFVLTLSFTGTVFAEKLWDSQPVSAGGYGTLTGSMLYTGMFTDFKKVVSYGTEISQLYGSLNTILKGYIEIKGYTSGADLGRHNAPTVKNKTSTNGVWKGQSDSVNKNTISVYGCHEVSGSGVYYTRTQIYGF